MGRRQKRKPKKTGSHKEPLQHARRFAERGDLRSALKEAKACYAHAPREEHRRFLEEMLLKRSRQLLDRGMHDEGRALLRDLLQLGITHPDVAAAAPELLVAAGMADSALALAAG